MVAAGDAFGVWAFLVLPILSLAMGWVAWMRVEDSQGKLTGDVYAIQAVQISCLWLLLGAVVLAVAWVFGPF
jgi:hypothetical protein